MWTVYGQTLKMAEGDWGIALLVTVTGATLDQSDSLKITVKTAINGSTVLEKSFSGIQDNTVRLELSEEETALLAVGQYVYCVDWYQNGNFLCNLVPFAAFWVVDKA